MAGVNIGNEQQEEESRRCQVGPIAENKETASSLWGEVSLCGVI